MRNSELMRRRANVSTLDLGRIKSDLEAIGEILQEGKKRPFISVCVYHFTLSPLPASPPRWPTYELRTSPLWVTIAPIHTYITVKQVACTYSMRVELLVWSVSLWLRLLRTFCGLLRTQRGSVSTEEFVKRTDWVPLMSVLLLFNITTEHTWNSRRGAAPFDM